MDASSITCAGLGRIPRAQLLLRVFFIQALRCRKCSTAMAVLAFISDPPVIAKILCHLRLPTEPLVARPSP